MSSAKKPAAQACKSNCLFGMTGDGVRITIGPFQSTTFKDNQTAHGSKEKEANEHIVIDIKPYKKSSAVQNKEQTKDLSEEQQVGNILEEFITAAEDHLSKADRVRSLLKRRLDCMEACIDDFETFLSDDHPIRKKVKDYESMLEDFNTTTQVTSGQATVIRRIRNKLKRQSVDCECNSS